MAQRQRVVIVGGGFAGFTTARTLSKIAKGAVEIVLINPTDYFLYLPLLPEVAAGILDPRKVAIPLVDNCPGVRHLLATVDKVDVEARRVECTDAEGNHRELGYDRLVIAVGSVNKLLPVPGVVEHAHGFRSLAEALYLRDHLIRQIELADASDDPEERRARCTFVVVGAGYTGTEVAAQGQLLTLNARKKRSGLRDQPIRWILADLAPRILPELDQRLSRTAHRTLSERGVEIRTGTSVAEATAEGVKLSDGEFVATRSLIWCVGVRPDPLVESLGLPTERGRLLVDEFLRVPGHPEIYACGDAAAVPDLARPGQYTAMTAQHAGRQGKRAARNIAASYGHGQLLPYKHSDLGFVVDLGGLDAAANPLGVPLSGLPAKVVTRGYHLLAVPGGRARIAGNWLLDTLLPRQTVQLDLVRGSAVPLDSETLERPHGLSR
ncbi:NADH dehydrogenase [Streptosporangium becharense]|uniref:NADH dehydrogenase n=1 Tax=Streptosporangium becharense TaxID=1816182 RepID=A0A7W9IFH6_9ACTN|nr:NAD(P)/FAD-dependent oxidoreductase [Streptosporangium becharense]MBB2909871.1 NADH dehydrogenase [Streptosporangium becharense]MBB5819174.1 NADH dehydrogenase [Streptosporangium becharense]